VSIDEVSDEKESYEPGATTGPTVTYDDLKFKKYEKTDQTSSYKITLE